MKSASLGLCIALSLIGTRVDAATTSTRVPASVQVEAHCTASIKRNGVEVGSAANREARPDVLLVGRVFVTCAPNTKFRLAPITGASKLEDATGNSFDYEWSVVEGAGPFVATGGRQNFAVAGRRTNGTPLPAGRYTDLKDFPVVVEIIL